MFRYGGPIKEGIMDGIREPKKNGGAMGINKPKRGLVNEPGSYAGFLGLAPYIGAGLAALRTGAMRMAPKVANFFRTQTGSIGPGSVRIPGAPGTPGRFTTAGSKLVEKAGPGQAVYQPNYLGRDPLVRLVGGTYKAVTSPTATGLASKAARFATSPSSIIAGVAYYLWPDGKERTTPPPLGDSGRVGTSGAPGGGNPEMFLTPQGDGSKKGGGVELTDKELRQKRIDRYRDIMDIKGMNKKAAYNSLIDASRLINESGDFKGDIKSGRLINQIIQATSKQFDKPAQTKDAIDTLILKGEIEKDIKASDPQAQKKAQLLDKQILIADKTLAGDTFTDIITERYSKGKVPRGNELAGILRATEGVKVTTVDSTKIPQGVDAQTFFESEVNDAKDQGKPIVPGYYVIDDRVLVVDEQGKVKPVL
jgi:hypothetical protein